jgi:acetylornithine deacetylase
MAGTAPRPETLRLLGDLIAFRSVSRTSNMALIDHVRGYLADLGIESRLVHDETGTKANLFATLGPADVPGILLSGHSDVVTVEGQDWTSDPFVLAERDGRLFGRGTADMKGFVASALALFGRAAGRTLSAPLHLALSYDEEIGCIGVRRLIDSLAGLPVRPRLCIVGEPTEMQVVVAHKGKAAWRVEVRGLEAHSSLAPRAVNAIEHAAELIVFIRALAAERARTGPRDEAFDVPVSTFQVGTIGGGTALNVVAGHCHFEFEVRHLPDDDPQALFALIEAHAREVLEPQMRAIAADTGIVFHPLASYPGLDIAPEDPAVALAKRLAGRNDHAKVAFGTEAGLFQKSAGIATVICGPGRIAEAHKPDEWLALDQLAQCDAFLDRVVDHLAR